MIDIICNLKENLIKLVNKWMYSLMQTESPISAKDRIGKQMPSVKRHYSRLRWGSKKVPYFLSKVISYQKDHPSDTVKAQ